VGKTRLALAVAADLLADYTHGVCFVDLAPISDPALLVPQIARALGVTESGSRPLEASLYAYLRNRRVLIVLDNLEHVITVALQIARLLAAAPGLTMLATSRVALQISAEYERVVTPLALPEQNEISTSDRVAQSEAVQLFVERAQAVDATFALDGQNMPVVVDICRQLDGLPLAIELAAAHLKHARPDAILAQLSNRLAHLTNGPQDLPARQQTLRDAIAWSFHLLDPHAQHVFVRLGVFVGGFTATAAAAVTGWKSEGWATQGYSDIEDVLHALVSKSLLRRVEEPGATPRFSMLATIRAYALEQLAVAGVAATLERRHIHYYMAFAEEARRYLTGAKRTHWLEQLDAEYDNLREALARSAADADAGTTRLRLGSALWWYWYFRGMASEGRAWLNTALTQADTDTPREAVQWVRCGIGVLAWVQGDQEAASEHMESSITGWRVLGEQHGLAYALTFHGMILQYRFDFAAARPYHEESVAIFRHGHDQWGLALALALLADLCYFEQDLQQARALYEESITIARALMDGWNLAWAVSGLGFVAYIDGAYEQAEQLFAESVVLLRGEGSKLRLASTLNKQGNLFRLRGCLAEAADCYEASLALFRELDTQMVIAGPLHNLGFIALQAGDDARAVSLFAESIAVARAQQDWGEIATALGGFACVAAIHGDLIRATRIFATMERILTTVGEEMDPANRAVCNQHCAMLRQTLGQARFAEAWAAGEQASAEQLLDEVV
jgi:predicted ATPase